jgi:predicted Zn-dependent peptidase
MEFRKKVLDNGLSIVGEINPFAKSAAVGFFVRTGARDETSDINGVSHFLEHMLFKGTERLNSFEVNEAFDRTGAQFNAFTSEELTVFFAAILPEYLKEITALWIELMRPALRDVDFDVEKNVIKEEIAMYRDLPEFEVSDKCRSLHFDGYPCGNSVLGSEKSINNLTSNQMREYFERRYVPNNVVVALTGNFDWDKISNLVQKGCDLWQEKKAERIIDDFPGSNKKERIERSNVNREYICLINRGVSVQDPRRFAAFVLACIIGDISGSRFFWELVDKALAQAASMQFGGMDGTGIFFSQLQCSKENSEKVMEIVRRIFREVTEKAVTEDELIKAKNKILSALVIKNEVPMGRLVDLGFNWIYLGQYRAIAEDVEAIKKVTVQDIYTLTRQLNLQEFTELHIGPQQ